MTLRCLTKIHGKTPNLQNGFLISIVINVQYTGDTYDYLGVDLDWLSNGEVKASMITYLLTIIRDFPELINIVTATLAVNHLFQVCDKAEAQFLPEE